MPGVWTFDVMLVSEGLAAVEAILICVNSVAIRAMMISGPELLPRAISGSIFLLHLGSMLMSKAVITIGDHRNHIC